MAGATYWGGTLTYYVIHATLTYYVIHAVADPGFSREGRQPQRRALIYYLA